MSTYEGPAAGAGTIAPRAESKMIEGKIMIDRSKLERIDEKLQQLQMSDKLRLAASSAPGDKPAACMTPKLLIPGRSENKI